MVSDIKRRYVKIDKTYKVVSNCWASNSVSDCPYKFHPFSGIPFSAIISSSSCLMEARAKSVGTGIAKPD